MKSKGSHLLNTSLAEGIRTIGFRRWYERELMSGHAQLVLLVLAVVGFVGCLELMPALPSAEGFTIALYGAVCAAIGAWALRRYLYLLMRAEAIAHQANCPQCKAYGCLRLAAGNRSDCTTGVQCRRCGYEWRITA